MCRSIAEGGRRCTGGCITAEQFLARGNKIRAYDRERKRRVRNLTRLARAREHREQLAATFDVTTAGGTSLAELRDADNFRAWLDVAPDAGNFIASKVREDGVPLARSLANSTEVRALALHGERERFADLIAEQRADARGHLDGISDDELWNRVVKEGARQARKEVTSAIRRGEGMGYATYATTLRGETMRAMHGMGTRAHLDGLAREREQKEERAREEARRAAAVEARAKAERAAEREAEREAQEAKNAVRRAAAREELKAATAWTGDEDTAPLSPAEAKVAEFAETIVGDPVKEFQKLFNHTGTVGREGGLDDDQVQRILARRLRAAGFDGHADVRRRVLVPHTDAARKKMRVDDRRRYQQAAVSQIRDRWRSCTDSDVKSQGRGFDVGTPGEVREAMTEIVQATPDFRPDDVAQELRHMAQVFSDYGTAQVEPVAAGPRKAPTAYEVTWRDETWTIPVQPEG